jgi:hypothetical protein
MIAHENSGRRITSERCSGFASANDHSLSSAVTCIYETRPCLPKVLLDAPERSIIWRTPCS